MSDQRDDRVTPAAQIGRPGHGRPVRRAAREDGRSAAAGRPAAGRRRPRRPVRCSPARRRARPRGRRAAGSSISTASSASGSPRPAPQHGAQLVLDVEADAVVDAVEAPVRCRSTCPPLRSALLTTASNTPSGPAGVVGVGQHVRRPSSSGVATAASRRDRPGRHEPDRRLVRSSIHSWHHAARTGRRAAPSAAPCPSRWPPTPGTRRPRARRACRRGSPTAAARRGPACTRTGGARRRA